MSLPINGYENHYDIYKDGRIYSRKSKKFLKQSDDGNGYKKVTLLKNGIQRTKKVHRLVAEHFVNNNSNKKCVNHIDGNSKNNNALNLEWCSYSENMKHAYKLGLRKPNRGNQYTRGYKK